MTGKELLFKCLRHEPTERRPWIPMAGVHAGFIKGYRADEVYQSVDKLVECLTEANKLYEPDGLILLFDLQLEAEILGCTIKWEPDSPPSVRSHPLEGKDEIPTQHIGKTDGRIPLVIETARRMKKIVGEKTALYGLFCGPYTLCSHLRGTNFFRDMRRNPDYVHKLMDYVTELAIQMCDIYLDEGVDVIVPTDPVVSQISPDHFNTFVAGPYQKIFEHIRKRKGYSAFFVCGNVTHLLPHMCKTVPDCIAVDENVDIIAGQKVCDEQNVVLQGNVPLTTCMLLGNQQDNMKMAVDILDSIKSPKNFILAPGCDMPYSTPVENTVAVSYAVHNLDKARDMVANYEMSSFDIDIELPDYEHLKKPLLEATLLDPTACAACTYMWAVACDAKKHFGDQIDVVEYRYNTPENIARMKKMGVKQLPSLYLNGKLIYSSIIPNQDDLFRQIEEVMK